MVTSRAPFPEILPYVSTVLKRRRIAGRLSTTEILSLRPDGTRTTQYDPAAQFGIYTWGGQHWKLMEICNSRREARDAAARIRQ
jgi:hypothetical protein